MNAREIFHQRGAGEDVVGGIGLGAVSGRAQQRVIVDRDLLDGERHALDAGLLAELVVLAEARPLAQVNRKTALQVWQSEGFLAVTAVGRADQLE